MQLSNYESFPTQVPVVIEDNLFLYPFMISPIFLTKKEDIEAATYAMEKNSLILLITTKEGFEGSREESDLHKIGVIGSIMRKVNIPDGRVKILFQGMARGELIGTLDTVNVDEVSFQSSMVHLLENKEFNQLKVSALIGVLNEKIKLFSKVNNNIPADLLKTISETDDPYRIVDLVSSLLKLSKTNAYEIYANADVEKRLLQIIDIIASEMESAKVEKEIRSKVHTKIEQTNKEYFLKEQIKEINKELGVDAQREEELEEFRKKLEVIKPHVVEDTFKEIEKQLERFARMHPDSGDSAQIQTYLEWVFELPFGELTSKALEVQEVQDALDADHFSLEKPKERIVEFFSVRQLAEKREIALEGSAGTILCFSGPPGVGKTSLANSIAKALNRPLVRIALGGLEDVTELRGHRRTYVGAMPGRLVQGLITAKSMDPVIVLDEIDKVGRTHRGDPTAVLLEILDPEQNKEYRDHYLNFDIDLSKAIFIATANDVGQIPAPLRDRMEFIEVSSYTPNEKLEIAKQYLIPQELNKHALNKDEFEITDKALKLLIDEYTREPGVRGLRRKVAGLMRKVATKFLLDENNEKLKIKVKDLPEFADKKVFEISAIDQQPLLGVVNGLAWTAVGGDVLKIEAIKLRGKGTVKLTGSLGDVMKESAHIAFSVVKILVDSGMLPVNKELIPLNTKENEATENLDVSEIYKRFDLHIHVPEGATPKDGPSAGITMAVAIASILSEKRVDNRVAMTGELTLTGKVLPIGGLKEKLIAAYKAGVTKALIPEKNYERDLDEIPDEVKNNMEIIGVSVIDEVLAEALV
ncbi:MAG: ATP-dependent protease La (EC Type I [uncultured Sulfurovum sp.]|uniref:Lon protease n=1 Tax=uncultured Sulfurovum sp. TaxID=269237 RepID=A0A6S6S0N4_9BACT|nr:MAG: ATP-dependent protease La (EC Type I [uncultured Sulfurovum sp.]